MANFDDLQKFGKEQFDTVNAIATSLAKGFQTIATETADYSKRALETNSSYLQKLVGAKSWDNAVEIQSEYAKVAYEDLIAQASKIGDLYTNLAKEAFKPVENVIAKVQEVQKAA